MAKNCNAKIDPKNGAEATDWKEGKPVRVIRNCKGRKHSKYAPEEGNRYDGIYKVQIPYKYKAKKINDMFLMYCFSEYDAEERLFVFTIYTNDGVRVMCVNF